jgi:FlaA1/EpsC-like NDP-sugar epimerase
LTIDFCLTNFETNIKSLKLKAMLVKYSEWLEFLRIKGIELFKKHSLPRWIIFLADNMSSFFAFLVAYVLRYNLNLNDFAVNTAIWHAITATSVYALVTLFSRSYAGLIRHTTIIDILKVLLTTTFSLMLLIVLTIVSVNFRLSDKLIIPFSILFIHYIMLTLWLSVMRIIVKILFLRVTSNTARKKRILIYGAGDMGVIVKRLIDSDINGVYYVAGFLDDKKGLQGKKLNEKPVYSFGKITRKFIQKNRIDALIFAIQNFPADKKSKIIKKALELGLEIMQTPSVETWLNGRFEIHQIEKVKLEDLLGREPIKLNMSLISKGLNMKTILVTGAAGSIGSEIVRQLTRFNVKKLILVDQAETPMFHLENELRTLYSRCQVEMILADVTQQAKMENIFSDFRPEVVFHAAAYKHVPQMEENPHEAIRVNVGGTKLLTRLALKYGVKKFVMISTDKAVNPTNVMGASKRICEMIVQARARNTEVGCQFIVTRFGNVLGSNGSVIPIFTKQIQNGGPVTVTHPEMSRYFMTIPEACQLVLEAGFMGKGGEIFVFDMGKPVKITDLANQMIRLSGFVPGKDIEIIYTGLRPGEKLYEELLTDKELSKPTYHPKIMISQAEKFNKTEILVRIQALLGILYSLSKNDVVSYCQRLVPEFKTSNLKYIHDHKVAESVKIENNAKKDLLIQIFKESDVHQ